jgi:hypothetical protein
MRLIALAALLIAGCTFLTQFNPEGQPCDTAASPESQCLERFHCENGKCVRGDYDAGVPGSDAG